MLFMKPIADIVKDLKDKVEVLRDTLQLEPNDPTTRKTLAALYYELVPFQKSLQGTPLLRGILMSILDFFRKQIQKEQTTGVFLSTEERQEMLEHCESILTFEEWSGEPYA